ncbi:MAG: ABC transporter permease [Chloroflexi bacterium]|nr:ABC transporter permease [Chloroflexota bacterium]
MGRVIAQRLIWLVFVLVGISIMTFVISHVVPADPIRAAAGFNARPEQIENLRRRYGMDKPLPQQYLIYMSNILHGDMGTSIRTRRPVLEDIRQYFPATAELTMVALAIMLAVGIPFGIISATKKDKMVDHMSRIIALAGVSMPLFWLGLLLQLAIYGKLGWLPAQGRLDMMVTPPDRITGMYIIDSILERNWDALGSSLQHIILPAVTLAFGSLAVITRMVRSSMLDAMGQDYIRTSRAKGLSERRVILRHALKNALIPTVTLVGLQVGYLLGGDFLVEIIFSWPGIGYYAVQSMTTIDIPAIMGVTLLIASIYVLANLVTDLTYSFLDPRIRLE